MNRMTEPNLRTPKRKQRPNMTEVLAQLRSSGSMHFFKALPKTALPKTALHHPRITQTAKLYVPLQFVEDHGDKVEELVTLRVRTSSGRSSRSWLVHCCVSVNLKVQVTIAGGWAAFVVDNHLKLGDFVVFVLREDARSEFEVLVFRGPLALPYFPDQGECSHEDDEEEDVSSDSEEEEKTNNQSRLASPVHQQDEHNQAFRRDIGEGNPAPLQHIRNPRVPPRFSKRLKASNIGGSNGEFNPGQFEFPNRFIRDHGEHVHDIVKLQGIHENSRNYVMPLRRRSRNLFKQQQQLQQMAAFWWNQGAEFHHAEEGLPSDNSNDFLGK